MSHSIYKMIIVVNNDLKMCKGKIAAQVGRAISAMYQSVISGRKVQNLERWLQTGEGKIVLKASQEEFNDLLESHSPDIVIKDAGHPQVYPGSITVLAYYPRHLSQKDEKLGNLKLL